jgi:hypothetical protein
VEDYFGVSSDRPKKHPFWNKTFTLLELVLILLISWWTPYHHLPAPGWAVAFIAVAAAAMSVHDDMKRWQKGLWLLIIGGFLVTELRAISKDRMESQNQAEADRKAQNENFAETAKGLTTVINGIGSTLQAANTTLLQTQPHAAIRFDSFEFTPGSAPSQFASNSPYSFNYHYLNGGSITATNIKILVETYVAKVDDKESQLELVRKFEKTWNFGSQTLSSSSVLVPNYPSFSTAHRTFTDDEIKELTPSGTIYYLLRFEYSDNTGRWRTDACGSFQRSSPTQIDMNVFHPCYVFQKFRYPV